MAAKIYKCNVNFPADMPILPQYYYPVGSFEVFLTWEEIDYTKKVLGGSVEVITIYAIG